MALAPACHKAPVVTTRAVVAYVPQACSIDGGAYAEYFAYGDFDPPGPPATGHFLSAVGDGLTEIDDQARALVMTAGESQPTAGGNQRNYEGVGAVPPSGDVDVLLLPTLASCALSTPVGARTGSTLAPIGDQRVLVVGGTGGTTPPTFVARLDTGEVDPLGGADLQTPRANASVTAFAGGALVAGGANDSGPLATAEVFSTASGGFDKKPFALSEPRTQHGAVVLANGQTLLVGGLGSADPGSVLSSMEMVDPVARTSQEEGVGNLAFARRNPTVLRMASGEILVAGGFDKAGQPVSQLEWFTRDATPEMNKTTVPFAQGAQRAFISLQGGGALAVVTPPVGTSPAGFQNVWVIDATGAIEAGVPVPPPLASPVLFGGAGGAPVLWTGDRWLQWLPYAGAFGEISVLDDVPAVIGDATCSPDPGAAMWLDPSPDRNQLTLLRFDTRNPYSSLPGALLVTGPQEMAPDRLSVTWSVDQGLTLPSGTPGAAAFVTDRTYADVAIDVDATESALVVLRDATGNELDIGGPGCLGALVAGNTSTVHVERHGGVVTWALAGGAAGTCALAGSGDARVSVGVRASTTAPAVVKDFRVARLGAP